MPNGNELSFHSHRMKKPALSPFRLLVRFEETFSGRVYRHRDSTLGNRIGRELYEDLYEQGGSARFRDRVDQGLEVVNRAGRVHSPLRLRRNDSVCGPPPAGFGPVKTIGGFALREGPVAAPHLGCEVKIVAKSQTKQIDRVLNDLEGFALKMKRLNPDCINVAVVGVNHETEYVGHEGRRRFKGSLGRREAANTEQRLYDLNAIYDEVLILRFKATNARPYPFKWVNERGARLDYGAALTRVAAMFDKRFP